jgi:protein-S-isoprenylcysteine O-methyltransferase Ste14
MILFFIIWIAWFASEILLNRLLKSGREDQKNKDKNTIHVIWGTAGIANTLGILSAIYIFLPIGYNLIIPYSGLFIIIAGMIIRFYAVWSLGKYFTVDVTIRKGHMVRKDGIYKFIRHPSYLGSIVSFLGFGISLNNWISLIIIFISATLAMIYRIKIEEKTLLEYFGDEYSEYMKKTYRLLPGVY